MKKALIVLTVCLMLVLTASVVSARPAKDDYGGKTAGNNGFTNVVGDNYPDNEVTGWVKYSKEGKTLHTTWVLEGLEPGLEYQLKLHSKCGDDRILRCETPGEYVDGYWECADWGGEPFLVMAIAEANASGRVNYSVKEARLPGGDYKDMQFLVTVMADDPGGPWDTAWTWENSPDSDGDSCVNEGGDWGSDLSVFTIVD